MMIIANMCVYSWTWSGHKQFIFNVDLNHMSMQRRSVTQEINWNKTEKRMKRVELDSCLT
jgi:hypothetical protein